MKTQDRTIREKFRDGVIATLLLDQQSGHKPTNEHFANRITLLFDHYVSELKQPEKQEIEIAEEIENITNYGYDRGARAERLTKENRKLIIELQEAVNKLLEK